MTSQKRSRFWIDPALQFQMLTTVLALVAGSIFLVAYSVFHGLEEASLASHQIFHSLDWVRETMRGPLFISATISLMASAIIALAWSHRFAGPLRVLSAAVGRLAQGNLSVPVRIRKSDTHQELLREFAQMQERLRERLEADRKALRSASSRLEGALSRLPEDHEARQSARAVIAEIESIGGHYQL